jgi:hypothetical protein
MNGKIAGVIIALRLRQSPVAARSAEAARSRHLPKFTASHRRALFDAWCEC